MSPTRTADRFLPPCARIRARQPRAVRPVSEPRLFRSLPASRTRRASSRAASCCWRWLPAQASAATDNYVRNRRLLPQSGRACRASRHLPVKLFAWSLTSVFHFASGANAPGSLKLIGEPARRPRLQFRGERQQRDILRPLDCHCEPSLVPRASSGHAARKNLAAFLQERRQNLRLFVIDVVRLIDAEPANLLLANEASFAALRGTAWTTRPAAWRTGTSPTRASPET